MLVIRRLVLAFAAAVPLALIGTTALTADAYPSRYITMVVPYAAGGPSDSGSPPEPRASPRRTQTVTRFCCIPPPRPPTRSCTGS